ncbi:GTPase [uncultured Actinobacillus sp.]|uniref:GTPase n=1 Tax=uncultured Actinobacillus sp. TaxID=417616 RepID=UPI0025DA732E|nr:GTPase [uncultured Actinobacillus sp.]
MNYQAFLDSAFDLKKEELNIGKLEEKISEGKEKLNVLIMGASGVGKSSLINAIFGMEIAKTGDGKPITQELEKISVKEKGLTLWDTKGIESKDFDATMKALEDEIEKGVQSLNHKNAPHIALLCISEASKRVEPRELELIALSQKYKIPTIIVFTKTEHEAGQNFVDNAKEIINKKYKDFIKDRYARVNSVEYVIQGHKFSKSGLEPLIDLISSCIEEGHSAIQKHFLKIQTVKIEEKYQAMLEEAKKIVHLAATSAGAVGASPIPGSDAPAIAAIQGTMIYKLNSEFEVDMEQAAATSVITGILGITALAQVGKAVVAGVLKFIPVAGAILGGAISATTAFAITEAVGFAYIEVLKRFYNAETGKVDFPENTALIVDVFNQIFKKP